MKKILHFFNQKIFFYYCYFVTSLDNSKISPTIGIKCLHCIIYKNKQMYVLLEIYKNYF